ncbi:acylphosphatase [Zooshikella harenae]|uniref:acylphosphatase n=1 Tax=Zooshikella harenae TaxID=2827238 RepID=A0ABS5ZAI1_9GAMM|nr:acylphosphatase [Zooshikella harenae]MBU2710280.1 acylphosphatase [Zooshikella harenae]
MSQICKKAWVTGRVQGVWFRGSTQLKAVQLGITGYAYNLPDGRVEVVMCGDSHVLQKLEEWLSKGPPMADVQHVEVKEIPWDNYQEFDVR